MLNKNIGIQQQPPRSSLKLHPAVRPKSSMMHQGMAIGLTRSLQSVLSCIKQKKNYYGKIVKGRSKLLQGTFSCRIQESIFGANILYLEHKWNAIYEKLAHGALTGCHGNNSFFPSELIFWSQSLGNSTRSLNQKHTLYFSVNQL